ncbi:MAG: alternative oxidase [Minisyncoccia bacterium]
MSETEYETLIESLNNPEELAEYKRPYDSYRPALLPRMLGTLLVVCGNIVYGKVPSYQKFRAVEVIARVPYHSWASAAFTFLTLFYADETRALKLSAISRFARFASDNETMHVVVISQLARKEQKCGVVRHTVIPMLFAFFYFWASYAIYLMNPRWSLELNYLFEQHAFDQYSLFLERYGDELKKKPIMSDFLDWYGRKCLSQYEFFQSVRNDEIVHRNRSIREIGMNRHHAAATN